MDLLARKPYFMEELMDEKTDLLPRDCDEGKVDKNNTN